MIAGLNRVKLSADIFRELLCFLFLTVYYLAFQCERKFFNRRYCDYFRLDQREISLTGLS